MADYRKVHVSLWNDDAFPFMSDDGKLVVLHLMTGPYSNALGLYKCSLGALADELRWDLERYRQAFQEAEDAGFVEYDPHLLVVYLPRFLADNPPANPNVLAGWVKKWEELPKSRLKDAFLQELEAHLSEFGARDELPSQRTGFIEAFERKWRKHCGTQEAGAGAARARHTVPPVPEACPAIRPEPVAIPEIPPLLDTASVTPTLTAKARAIAAKAKAQATAAKGSDLRLWPSPEALMDLYNATIPPGHPRSQTLSEARRLKAQVYLTQFPARDFWVKAFEAIQHSSLLLGQRNSPGHQGFRADLDWFLQRGKNGIENCVKAHDGKYRDTAREQMHAEVGKVGVALMDVADVLLQRHGFTQQGHVPQERISACAAMITGPNL